MNLATILEMPSTALPDREAVVFGSERLTYAGLLSLALRWSAYLDTFDTDRIAVIGENHLGVVGLLLGASARGYDVSLMNPRLKANELSHALATTEAKVLFTCGVRSTAPEEALATLDFDVERVEVEHSEPPAPRPERPARRPATGAAGEQRGDGALHIFTSGTTSLPKAVVLRQAMIADYLLGSYEPLSAGEHETSLVAAPLFHIAGIMNVMSAIYCARRLVLLPRFEPELWLHAAEREQVTQAFLVPMMLRQVIARLRETPETALPQLRHISYGGSPSQPGDIRLALETLPDVDFVGAFGLTETSSTIAILDPEDHRRALADDQADLLASVGRPLPGVEIQIVESETSAPVAQGVQGEIVVRGPQVSAKYLGGISRTDADGWFHTGDLGWFDALGYLYIAGRADDMIQRGAENISPREIELTFESQPGIAEVAAVGLPDVEWGETVAVVVVPRAGARVTESELRAIAESRLAGFKRPARYALAQTLPRNTLGKLLRSSVRSALLDGRLGSG